MKFFVDHLSSPREPATHSWRCATHARTRPDRQPEFNQL